MGALVTCPACRGSGIDLWMTTDDYRLAPFNRREQWYSASECSACDGSGQVAQARADAIHADAREFNREFDEQWRARDGERWARMEAEQRAWSEANPLEAWAGDLTALDEAMRDHHAYCQQFSWNRQPEGGVAR